MELPNEILHQVYYLLSPSGFNAARHTCRTWFLASFQRKLLVEMLQRGGWWSSVLRLVCTLDVEAALYLDQERLMSLWISRECHLADSSGGCAFHEAGCTDLRGLTAGSEDPAMCTVSSCGRYLMVNEGWSVCVYELNHTCACARERWSLPMRRRDGPDIGRLRPVTRILESQRIISCSMDTSAGRFAVAILTEGRRGLVCDIRAGREDDAWRDAASIVPRSEGTLCPCWGRLASEPPTVEEGRRLLYGDVGADDDPPCSVAICPHRSSVAFGCSSGIEIH